MTNKINIRWIQHCTNYKKALSQLEKFIVKEKLNELEEQGLIQAFECTHELVWNVLRDYLREQGHIHLYGLRAVGNCRQGSDIDLILIGADKSFNEVL